MSKILTRLTRQLASKGNKNAKGMAITLLKKAGNMDSNGNLTEQGKKRNSMSPGERANDRAAKYSGRKASDFKYNKATNRSRVKKGK